MPLFVKSISYLYSLEPFLNIVYKLIGSSFLKNDDKGILSSSFKAKAFDNINVINNINIDAEEKNYG